MIVFVFVVSEAQETALMTGGFNGYEGARLVSAIMMILTIIQMMMKLMVIINIITIITIINIIAIITIINIINIINTRPKPAYGRQGLAGSLGQNTDEVSTFWGVLNVSLRPCGAQLGFKPTKDH